MSVSRRFFPQEYKINNKAATSRTDINSFCIFWIIFCGFITCFKLLSIQFTKENCRFDLDFVRHFLVRYLFNNNYCRTNYHTMNNYDSFLTISHVNTFKVASVILCHIPSVLGGSWISITFNHLYPLAIFVFVLPHVQWFTMHLHKFVRNVIHYFHASALPSCKYQILYGFFLCYMYQKIQLFTYNNIFVFYIL